jgi:hypothetical protein
MPSGGGLGGPAAEAQGVRRSRERHFEVPAYLLHEAFVDFPVARHGGHFSRDWVPINGMAATFTKQVAAIFL